MAVLLDEIAHFTTEEAVAARRRLAKEAKILHYSRKTLLPRTYRAALASGIPQSANAVLPTSPQNDPLVQRLFKQYLERNTYEALQEYAAALPPPPPPPSTVPAPKTVNADEMSDKDGPPQFPSPAEVAAADVKKRLASAMRHAQNMDVKQSAAEIRKRNARQVLQIAKESVAIHKQNAKPPSKHVPTKSKPKPQPPPAAQARAALLEAIDKLNAANPADEATVALQKDLSIATRVCSSLPDAWASSQ